MAREELALGLLHAMERELNASSIEELIRLIGSEAFADLDPDHIRSVAQYRAIELAGETFFERSFSTGKEAASSLALARELGAKTVLRDLRDLRASITGGS